MSEKEKLIIESRVKPLLLALPGVKSVGQEVLDMLSEGVRVAAATTIMGMCRVTPSGRLLLREAADSPQSVVYSQAEAAPPPEEEGEGGPRWTRFHDWQREVRLGRTKLPFEEWKKKKSRKEDS